MKLINNNPCKFSYMLLKLHVFVKFLMVYFKLIIFNNKRYVSIRFFGDHCLFVLYFFYHLLLLLYVPIRFGE